MKKTLLIISAASLLLVGCAKEQLVEKSSYTGPVTVVSATFESLVEDGATKAAVSEEGAFTWQNGDKAAFAESSSSTSYCTGTNNDVGTTASFAIEGVHSFTSSSWAIYPYDLTTEQTPATLKVKVPASRVWAENQTNVAMCGVKETSSNTFNFSHMGGLVRVRVKNVPTNAREFVFKASGCKINGVFEVTEDGGKKIISTGEPATGEDTYTLTWTTAPEAENTMDFYIPLPVGEYSGGFAFYLNDEDHNTLYSKVGSTAQSIARKKLLLMPAITLVGGSIEPAEKAAVVANIPEGYSGDFLLPQSEKVLLKINASTENHNITLKYDEGIVPTNLEIKVIDGDNAGNYNAKLLGNLPSTHVEFTQGNIDHTELTTSSSTLAVIYPATIGTLTVKGGNVVLQGATVNMIEVAEGAVADASSSAPVEIKMEKYTPTATGSTEQTPKVTGSVVAKANVQVAPVAGETVTVVKVGTVNVEDTGEGTVKQENDEVSVSTFEDFKNAVDKVVAGQTIKVAATISDAQGITVAEGKQFTVDFGGFTYTCASNPAGSDGTKNQVFQLLQNSTITFKNGTIDVAVAAKENFRFIIQNYANLTLEDITLDGSNLAISDGRVNYTVSNNSGSVEFKGKTNIKAADTKGVAFDAWDDPSYDGVPQVTVNTTGTIEGQVEVTGGTLVVDAGSFTHSGTTIWAKSGNVTINNGSFASTGNCAIGVTGTTTAAPTVTLKNGTFNSQESTVLFDGVGATVSIEGGTYNATDNAVISGNGTNRSGNANNVTISGGTFNGGITSTGYIACGIYAPWKDNITVTSGTFNITKGAGVVARAGVVTIDGGTFKCTGNITGGVGDKTVALPCECLVFDDSKPDYPARTADSKIVVKKGTFSDESALKYAAQNANITVKLEADRTAGGVFVHENQNQTIVFDLNGKTYTANEPAVGSKGYETQAFHLEKGNNVTFKNGTINCAAENKDRTWTKEDAKKGIAMIIQDYATLTLEDVTIDGTNIAHNGNAVRYMVSSNYGNVMIKGNTSIIAPEGDFAFDVYDNRANDDADYPGFPTVTWASTGSVTGNIELTGGKLVIASNLAYANTIMATAGTSSLEVNATLSATEASDWYLVKAGKEGKSGIVLNISGTGTLTSGSSDHCIPVTSDYGAQVNISGGTYYCYGDGECVYANRGGKVAISGGIFSVREGDTVKDLLNVQNDQKVTDIQCTGGTFIGRDPALGDDAKGGSFVADGYVSTENPTGTWTVSAQ